MVLSVAIVEQWRRRPLEAGRQVCRGLLGLRPVRPAPRAAPPAQGGHRCRVPRAQVRLGARRPLLLHAGHAERGALSVRDRLVRGGRAVGGRRERPRRAAPDCRLGRPRPGRRAAVSDGRPRVGRQPRRRRGRGALPPGAAAVCRHRQRQPDLRLRRGDRDCDDDGRDPVAAPVARCPPARRPVPPRFARVPVARRRVPAPARGARRVRGPLPLAR